MTTALEDLSDQLHASAAIPPGKALYPLYRRKGGPQGLFGLGLKISPPPGILSPDCPARSQSLFLLSYPVNVAKKNPY